MGLDLSTPRKWWKWFVLQWKKANLRAGQTEAWCGPRGKLRKCCHSCVATSKLTLKTAVWQYKLWRTYQFKLLKPWSLWDHVRSLWNIIRKLDLVPWDAAFKYWLFSEAQLCLVWGAALGSLWCSSPSVTAGLMLCFVKLRSQAWEDPIAFPIAIGKAWWTVSQEQLSYFFLVVSQNC